MLVVCIVSALLVPACAEETELVNASCDIVVERFQNSWFYYEETSDYRVAMQLADSGELEYAYMIFGTNTIHQNTDTVEVVSTAFSEDEAIGIFTEKRGELLSDCDSSRILEQSYVIKEQNENTYSLQAVPSNHADMILDALIEEGHSDEYYNRLLSTVYDSGYAVEIREQLVHQYVVDRNYALEVMTSISVVAAMTGLVQAQLIVLLEFIWELGEYVLAGNSTLYTYDVTLVYTKKAEINGVCELTAGRQLRWNAYIGTKDIILELYRDNPSEYYNLSNINFAKKAIEQM